MVPPANLDDLSYTELKNLVVALFEQVAELRRTIAAQADEIARLKGGPRPAEYQTERHGEGDRAEAGQARR
jgi:hypothetical protein